MKKIVLAYSGGLDTSFCIPYLIETYDAEVHTVTVDCMGLSDEEKINLEERALKLGAKSHKTISGLDPLYNDVISYLIKGNVLRDRTYPLSVGAERYIQAKLAADYAHSLKAETIAHGSTGAGNDQVRFDSALKALYPHMEIITPIRDAGFSREYQTEYLAKKDVVFPSKKSPYSINSGIWGTTVGGHETLDSKQALPFDAYPNMPAPHDLTDEPEILKITFDQGLPVAINDEKLDPVSLLKKIQKIGLSHGIGRGMHTGDTIIGIKGRIGFEAPVATIIYQAHKDIEKLVMTKWQRHLKDNLADHYGMMLHEALYFDPVMRDIEAFLDSSQKKVTGVSSLYLYRGNVYSYGTESPYSMMNQKGANYGEDSLLWTGSEAKAFSKLYGLSSMLSNTHANHN